MRPPTATPVPPARGKPDWDRHSFVCNFFLVQIKRRQRNPFFACLLFPALPLADAKALRQRVPYHGLRHEIQGRDSPTQTAHLTFPHVVL